MKSFISTCRNTGRSCRQSLRPAVPAFAFATVALLLFLGVNLAFAQTPPVVDGNLDDMITYAQTIDSNGTGLGLYITDKPDASGNPTPETLYNDLKFVPCPQPQPALGTHWVNGVEIFRHVFAYVPGSTTLYLGLRSEGMIGDSDGNNNPDTSGGGSCNPEDNIKDGNGISGNELYAWNFDLNCDGVSDGRITIQDNTVTGTGTLAGATGLIAFRQNGATGASGRDLEVQVHLAAPLPGAFDFVNVEANAFDGLSEDRSAGQPVIGNPAIDVTKTASLPSICPGQTTRFTVTINNSGQTELSVVVKDQLPSALTYAANLQSTCNVGAPTVSNGLLTFPAVTLAAGATCTISYDATAGQQCFGEVSNRVDVTGTFNSACLEKGGSKTVTDFATATVTCKAPASVEVTATGPASACSNAPVTISGTVHNTGQSASNVVVKVNGNQAFSQSVAAGATANWTIQATMPASCTAGQNVAFNVEAVATGDCGDDTANATVNVRCASPPCLTLQVNRDKESACPGDSIAFTGTATNCSPDSQYVTISVNGNVLRTSPMTGNGTYNFSFRLAMPQCTAGNAVTFDVVGSASNACGTPATKTVPLTVQCNNPPTVSVTAQADKQSGCPNESVTLSGQVTNTGAQSGTFTVTVGGQQAFTGTIQAGQSANWTFNTTLGNCTAGQSVSFAVVAAVSNSCGNAQDTKTVNVACNAGPCVELTADRVPTSACPGDKVTISGTVKNCSTASETIVVTVNGEQVFSQSVAAGQTQNWTKATNMPQCTAGSNVTWNVVATATGACPPVATQNKSVSVQCNSVPCVQLIGLGATKTVACPAESLTVFGTVKNCGAQAGTFTVTIGGQQVYNASLEPNASASFTRSVTQSACTAGANVDYLVHASVTNACGNNTADGTVSVRCQEKPCVELTASGPNNSCSNSPITIQGTVRNCGPNAATILVKVGDTQAYNQSVNAGQTANWTLQVPFSCSAGQSVSYVVTATVTNDCGTDTKTQNVSVLCQAPPCVSIDLNAPTIACVGSTIQLCGTVTNCSNTTENIEVHYQQLSQLVGSVPPGQSRSFCFEVRMPECTQGDVREWTVTAIATNDCGRAEKTAVDETKCKLPEIKVKKAAESVVNDGDIIHYTIIVENPGEAPLQNVTITDPLCPYTVYNDHASPAPKTEPAVGANGTVTWVIPLLAKGESMALTFEAKASLSTGGASCPGDVLCRNKVTASGTCSGTTDTTPVTSTDETATTIRCAVQNCPRSPGFWTQQCAQKGNGSTKFTVPQMNSIVAKVDDISVFFNWNSDSTFANFCSTVNPPKPMDQRKQAERQFATLLANYSTDVLNLTPSAGGVLLLDPNTPVSCSGFNATTIGALISEVDLKLVTLKDQNLGDSQVAAKYSAIGSCLDAINNGIGIPTVAGCDEGGDDNGDKGDDARGNDRVKLSAATPNPFTSTTQFSYEVNDNQAQVSVVVYNVAGRQVRTLVATSQPAGKYTITWDGRADDGTNVVRGVYFVRAMVAGQKSPVQRVLYIRDQQ